MRRVSSSLILISLVVFMFMSGRISLSLSLSLSLLHYFPDAKDMHENGYAMHNGIHHLTLGGVVTTPHGIDAHAVVHVSDDAVEVEGYGVLAPLSSALSLGKGNERNEVFKIVLLFYHFFLSFLF